MTIVSPLRFFFALGLHAGYALWTLAACFAFGLYMIITGPRSGSDDAVGMLLFVQMFLASTGFMESARRGHFDPLLTRATGRSRAIAAHWAASVLPGALSAIALLGLAAIRGGSLLAPSALAGSLAAVFIVSSMAWAAGFALARGTAGVLWTGALFAALLSHVALAQSTSPLAIVFCPFLLLRPSNDPFAITAAVSLASLPPLFICRLAPRLDLPLMERS